MCMYVFVFAQIVLCYVFVLFFFAGGGGYLRKKKILTVMLT